LIRIPRRRFAEDTAQWLGELRDLLALAVGFRLFIAAPPPVAAAEAA